MRSSERGEGLVEVLVASAIVGMVIAAVISGTVAATHQFGARSSDAALRQAAFRELRIATDILKYQGGSIAPAAIATTAPLPGASPMPVHLSIATTLFSSGGFSVAVTVRNDIDGRAFSASATLPRPVPLPSSLITAPVNGQAPL
ncbi:MAG TPA: prepilin-type N-terminal cleavage/methylation domain-containing protein [Candidatus Aquilonibacter sp.]|nr:prepilin-type N-terminal cleavage/methylation domain-containing protein [Candidatus Aquilonibacter sp.]